MKNISWLNEWSHIFDTCHNNENYDENPGIRKRYWMNQVMQLKQHLKTTTRAFKCINQIRKCISFWFFKNMLTFFHENLKMQNFDENPEIRKIYWMNQGMSIETRVIDNNKSFQMHGSNPKMHFILVFQKYVDIFSWKSENVKFW